MKKTRTTGDKLADALAVTTLVSCLLAITFGAGKANGAEEINSMGTGRVSLTATLKNAPAFQTVSWEIKRGGEVVAKTKRHSATFQVTPATYTATLICPNGNQRERQFSVGANQTTTVAIACD